MPTITATTSSPCPCCCAKKCYSEFQSNYTCASGTFGDPVFVQNVCVTPGSVSTSWTKTAGDTSSCTYIIYVAANTCCTTVGVCSTTAAPAAPTDHSDCTCCPCTDDASGNCGGCNTHSLPSSFSITFTGGSMMTSCNDCTADFDSFKVTAGTLSGMTFTLAHTGAACVYSYSHDPSGITISQYGGSGCTGTPINNYTDISITFTPNLSLLVKMGGGQFTLFDFTGGTGSPADCCVSHTITDPGTGASCFPDYRMGWGFTATITPCPS